MRRYYLILAASLLLALSMLSIAPAWALTDMFEPYKVTVGPDSNVYALIAGNDSVSYRIFEYTPDGRVLRTIESRTSDIAVDASGNLYYFEDLGICSVTRLDTSGKTDLVWYNDTNKSIATGAITVSPGGDLYVSIFGLQSASGDYGRCDIYVIGTDGSSRVVYSENVTGLGGGFSTMAVDTNGTIYGAGISNYVTVISPNGTATRIGKLGSENGTFSNIVAVAIGGDGYLYVAEGGNRRIQKLTTDGQFVAVWDGCGPDHFVAPRSVTADANGRVYVADAYNQRIVWFTPDYAFGMNTAENLKGQGTTWGNVIAGTNYTTVARQIEEENAAAAPAPGFAAFAALIGLVATVYCIARKERQ